MDGVFTLFEKKKWRGLAGAFAVGAIAVSSLAALDGTAVAETAAGGASIYRDKVYWWTPDFSGTDHATVLLAAGKTHESTSITEVGDFELAVTCTISNLGVDENGDAVASGLITKAPGNTNGLGTLNDKAGWKGESLGLLYNSGDATNNLLANVLSFAHKTSGNTAGSGIYNRLVVNAKVVKNEVGQEETPWMDQIERFGGQVNRATGEVTKHPDSWPQDTWFDLSCSATLDGVPVPLDGLVLANAESNGNQSPTVEESEHQVFTPLGEGADGATWHVLDIWDSCERASDVYEVGDDNSLTNHPILGKSTSTSGGNGVDDAMPECPNSPNKSFTSSVLLKNATGVHVKMHEDRGSAGAIAVGVYLSSDYGDAPASYGVAGNYWSGTWDNALEKGSSTVLTKMEGKTKQKDLDSTGSRSYSTGSSTTPNYFLGSVRDTESPKGIELNNSANVDDSDNSSDEDVFVSGTDISKDLKTEGGKVKYSYEAECTANNGTGYVGGWIDWNLDGEFDTEGEQATAECTGGKAKLDWEVSTDKIEPWLKRTAAVTPGAHATPYNDHSFLRLRISSKAEDITPNGIGTGEGEVEDHTITWDSPITIKKSVSPENAGPYTKVTWTVTVKNTGNIDYTDAFPMQFTDDLTDVLKIVDSVRVKSATAGQATVTGNKLTWTGPVAAQGEVTVTYEGTVVNYDDGEAVNTATSAYDGSKATATVKLPLITVAKKASPSPSVKKGDTVHYTITIANEGKGDAIGVYIYDNLDGVFDDGGSPENLTASSGDPMLSGNWITWYGHLAAGASATVEYDVVAYGNGDNLLKNIVSVDGLQKYSDTE
ncbi:MAG: DUF11 domain-containing protein, partial [Actinomycetaceae bacterium]|nr:DUF11 domain-containing protein [Actinomycetaceae bacterium]